MGPTLTTSVVARASWRSAASPTWSGPWTSWMARNLTAGRSSSLRKKEEDPVPGLDPALVLALGVDVTAADPVTVAAAASLLRVTEAVTSPGAGPGEAAGLGPGPGPKQTRKEGHSSDKITIIIITFNTCLFLASFGII